MIGNPDTFSVDFKLQRIDPAPFGLIEMWVGGKRLGLVDEPTFLYPVLQEIEWLAQGSATSEAADLVHRTSTEAAWRQMEQAERKYSFMPIEFFDNDVIHVARATDSARLIWRSASQPQQGTQDVLVPLVDVRKVAAELRKLFEAARHGV